MQPQPITMYRGEAGAWAILGINYLRLANYVEASRRNTDTADSAAWVVSLIDGAVSYRGLVETAQRSAHPALQRPGPWMVKQQPEGEWVIDRVNNGLRERLGEYETEAEARRVLNRPGKSVMAGGAR